MTIARTTLCLLTAALLAAGCATKTPEGPAWTPALEARRAALTPALHETGVAVVRTPENQLQLNLPTDVSFEPNSAAIGPKLKTVLDKVGDELKSDANAALAVKVVGFSDSRGDESANQAISVARAVAVQKHLEGRGVAAARMEIEGRGDTDPDATNTQRYGRALNRRVEILLR